MLRRVKLLKLLVGIAIGFSLSHLVQLNSSPCGKNTENLVKDDWKQVEATVHEKNEENLLFVGVMTAAKYLENRAQVIEDTWGKNVPGSLVFFSSEMSYSKTLPLVSLVGIDDSYPPQKKSFAMLKYMHDNFIDQFEWFMRADDDVYVRMDRLEDLLRSVDSRKPWFIGQTGKGNTDEFGLLSLDHDENFCMGGPGVILSRETLRRIAPYMEQCLESLFTTHEDVELGRCVKRFAGISCTWSYEMQVILYHNQSGENAFSGNLKQREVHRAITLHPVKQPKYMHRLHNYVNGLKIQELRHKILKLNRDILTAINYVSSYSERTDSKPELIKGFLNENDDYKLSGAPLSLTRTKNKNLDELLDWEFFAKSFYSYKDLNPRKRLGSCLKEGLSDVIREIMELINTHSKQRGRIIDFKEIFYGYMRLNPMYGVDLIVDLLLVYRKYRGHKMTVPVRRHAYVQQTFAGIDIREVIDEEMEDTVVPFHRKVIDNFQRVIFQDNDNNKAHITFLLPLKGRYETFRRFMRIFNEVCLKRKEPVRLIVILYRDETGLDYDNTLGLISRLYGNSSQQITVIRGTGAFSRGRALQIGTKDLNSKDLMFFVDADMVFNEKTLQRIRANTMLNKSVYFPIVYSLYSPSAFHKNYSSNFIGLSSFESVINEQNGFWRQFGFGIASLYKSDFVRIGGFNVSIEGWGMEDVDLYENSVKFDDVKVVRTVDDSLIHVYHPINCDNLASTQLSMCLGTKSNLLGSLNDFERYLEANKQLLR